MPADKSNLHIEANNVKINLLDVASDFQDTALQFSAADMAGLHSSTNGTVAPDNLNLSFIIPKNVLMTGREGSASASPIRLSFVLYESTKLYKLSNETTAPPSKLNINCTTITLGDNPVIAATIRGANTDHLSEPVTFKLRKPTPNLEYRCVYWDPESKFLNIMKGQKSSISNEPNRSAMQDTAGPLKECRSYRKMMRRLNAKLTT